MASIFRSGAPCAARTFLSRRSASGGPGTLPSRHKVNAKKQKTALGGTKNEPYSPAERTGRAVQRHWREHFVQSFRSCFEFLQKVLFLALCFVFVRGLGDFLVIFAPVLRQIARYLPHHGSKTASKTHPKSSHDKFKNSFLIRQFAHDVAFYAYLCKRQTTLRQCAASPRGAFGAHRL